MITKGRYTNVKKTHPRYFLDLFREIVRTNFKLRYNDSFLGFIWVLLKPLVTFAVLYVVFSKFRGNTEIPNYPIYLLLGVIIYTFFNEGFFLGMKSLLEKVQVILKVNFPREIVILSSLFVSLINLGINLLVLAVISFLSPINTNPLALFYFLLVMGITLLSITAISFFTSIYVVRFRDLDHVSQLVFQLLFYATPVFYPLSVLPQSLQTILSYNPLYIIIQASRNALLLGQVTFLNEILLIFLVSMLIASLGYIYFKSKIRKIAEYF